MLFSFARRRTAGEARTLPPRGGSTNEEAAVEGFGAVAVEEAAGAGADLLGVGAESTPPSTWIVKSAFPTFAICFSAYLSSLTTPSYRLVMSTVALSLCT